MFTNFAHNASVKCYYYLNYFNITKKRLLPIIITRPFIERCYPYSASCILWDSIFPIPQIAHRLHRILKWYSLKIALLCFPWSVVLWISYISRFEGKVNIEDASVDVQHKNDCVKIIWQPIASEIIVHFSSVF